MKKTLLIVAAAFALLFIPQSAFRNPQSALAYLAKSNFAYGTLYSSVASSATQLTITPGTYSELFPTSGTFAAVILGSTCAAPSTCATREIVKLALVTGNTYSVISRAQESTTTPTTWAAGSKIQVSITAGTFTEIQTELDTKTTGTGTAATITVGTVTTLSSGSSVTVLNVGTVNAAILNFGIPQGAAGATGPTGTTGAAGATGPTGTAGAAGAAATISVGTVSTLASGSSVTILNVGTSSAAIFNIGIPQGAAGASGGGTGNVLSVASANGAATVSAPTGSAVITIVSAPKLTTARTIAGQSFDGTGDITIPYSAVTGTPVSAATLTCNSSTQKLYAYNAGSGLFTCGTDSTGSGSGASAFSELTGSVNLVTQVSGSLPQSNVATLVADLASKVTITTTAGPCLYGRSSGTEGCYSSWTYTDPTFTGTITTAITGTTQCAYFDASGVLHGAGSACTTSGGTGISALTGDVTASGTGSVAATVRSASTSTTGIVQLSDSTSTTSSILAATPTAVKAAYDLAATKMLSTGTASFATRLSSAATLTCNSITQKLYAYSSESGLFSCGTDSTGSGSGGSVNSVGLIAPYGFTVTGSPVTSAGVFTMVVTAPTGTGSLVFATAPTLTGLISTGTLTLGNGATSVQLNMTDSDVAHGVTTLAPTNVWGRLSEMSGTKGGFHVTGFSSATDQEALELRGVMPTTPDDGKSAIKIDAYAANGTGVQAIGTGKTLLLVTNNDAARVTVLGNGNTTFVGSVTAASFSGSLPTSSLTGSISLTSQVSGSLPVANLNTGTLSNNTTGTAAGITGVTLISLASSTILSDATHTGYMSSVTYNQVQTHVVSTGTVSTANTLSTSATITTPRIVAPTEATLATTCSTTLTVDMALYTQATVTLNGACAVVVTNNADSRSFSIQFIQASTTAPTFSTAFKWAGATAPTWSTTAGKFDSLSCWSPPTSGASVAKLLCAGIADLR